jgi:hypothetical protein
MNALQIGRPALDLFPEQALSTVQDLAPRRPVRKALSSVRYFPVSAGGAVLVVGYFAAEHFPYNPPALDDPFINRTRDRRPSAAERCVKGQNQSTTSSVHCNGLYRTPLQRVFFNVFGVKLTGNIASTPNGNRRNLDGNLATAI